MGWYFFEGMKNHLLNPKKAFLFLTFGLGIMLFLLLWLKLNWKWCWAWWVGMSVVTFAIYGLDKLQAQMSNGQRVPEMVLHLLALAGGVAGAWIGRGIFRHKTLHLKFTLVLIAATVLPLALLLFSAL